MAVGEIWVKDDERFAAYVRPDELHLGFNFRLVEAGFDADAVRSAIEHSLAAVALTGTPATWTLSNHDVVRHVTRYGGGAPGEQRARAMTLVELALPGVIYLYNGEELGLPNVELPDWALQDPTWERSGRTERGRDGCRVPIPWEGTSPPFGFSTAVNTWLPQPNEWDHLTAEAQLEDPGSMLSLYREVRVPAQGRRADLRAEHVGCVRAVAARSGAAVVRPYGRRPAAARHGRLAGLSSCDRAPGTEVPGALFVRARGQTISGSIEWRRRTTAPNRASIRSHESVAVTRTSPSSPRKPMPDNANRTRSGILTSSPDPLTVSTV
jgi:hypothetical protein